MSFSCGIVGLPNVGKSTLFNALTKNKIPAENYPFCTIEPNKGIVMIPDERLLVMSKINKSKKIVPTTVEFVDIAGLVAGASKGEGLGNKFLSHIRELDAIIEVVRLFRSPNILREGTINPISDINIIHTELMLADLQNVEKRLDNIKKKINHEPSNELKFEQKTLFKTQEYLDQDKWLMYQDYDDKERFLLKGLHLLTLKPLLLVVNLDENDLEKISENDLFTQVTNYAKKNNLELVPLCIHLEEEISTIKEEKSLEEYREILGISHFSLDEIIKKSYNTLNLITYFTSGEKETKAWTVKKGTLAPQAAGVIHNDFEKGFIKAEVISFPDLDQAQSYSKCKELGKVRLEGKKYEIQDGDICVFKFNL